MASEDKPSRGKVQDSESREVKNILQNASFSNEGALFTSDAFLLNTFTGDGFRAGEKFSLADGETVNILLENPSGSGLIIPIYVSVYADADISVVSRRNVTIDAQGTEVQKNTRLIPGSNADEVDATLNFTHGATTSGGYRDLPGKVFGGTTPRTHGGSDSARYALESDANIEFEVTSLNSNNTVIVRSVFEEIEQGEILA